MSLDPFLYVIGADVKSQPVKIGISGCPEARMQGLQTSHHCELFVLAKAQIAKADDEQQIHELFSAHRLRGEWFRRSKEIVSFIDTMPGLGVYHAAARILKAREAKRSLSPRERELKQWLTANLKPLGPKLVPPPPPTQADADRMAAAVQRAGFRVDSRVVDGKIVIKFFPPLSRLPTSGAGQ